MEVEDHHNFSVNGGLIVHNCSYGLNAYHSKRTELEVKVNYNDLPEDILEDLDRADHEQREYILRKIGRMG